MTALTISSEGLSNTRTKRSKRFAPAEFAIVTEDTLVRIGIQSCLKGLGRFKFRLLTWERLRRNGHISNAALALVELSARHLRDKRSMERLRRLAASHRVIALLEQEDATCASALMEDGVAGIFVTSSSCDELVRCVREVRQGGTFLDRTAGRERQFHGAQGAAHKGQPLTRQEVRVLNLIADGLSNKEIAANLGVSLRTAENHRHAIKKKLGIQSIAGLVKFALQNTELSLKPRKTSGQR